VTGGYVEGLEEIKRTIGEHRPTLEKQFKVKTIAIFGSYARGEQEEGSDVDILVEFSEPIGFFAFLDLEEYLEALLGTGVDLVSKKALKPRIGENILREMVPV
jgi:predicted nucleotidyltransferase